MAGPPIPVEDSPKARVLVTPKVGGVATRMVVIDGSASSGSAHIVDLASATLATVQTEMVRLDFDSIDAVREAFLMLAPGQGVHLFELRWTVVTDGYIDDVAYAQRLLDNGPDLPPWLLFSEKSLISSPDAITSVYVVGVMAIGATIASCKGRLFVGGRSYA